jgi:hypothetical protein
MSLKQPLPTHQTSRTAKILYRPVGLVSGIVGGLVAGQVFKQIWKRVSPGHQADAPKALDAGYSWKEMLAAAFIQGAIYAVVKAVIERGGARVFESLTGQWPGKLPELESEEK